MRAVKVMLDEQLLERLHATGEVQRDGRSAVVRRAVAAYLRKRARASIANQYRRAYRSGQGLSQEFGGWEEQGVWVTPRRGARRGSVASSLRDP